MEILIITLDEKRKRNSYLLDTVSRIFNTGSYIDAIDLRSKSADELVLNGDLSLNGYLTVKYGRKWHWELSSSGGVGIIKSTIKALNQSESSLLLLEEDCTILPNAEHQFKIDIELLQKNEDNFDIAVFSGKCYDETTKHVEFMSNGWYYLTGCYMYNHCVYYSKNGRKKILNVLQNTIPCTQIDGLYGILNDLGTVRVIVKKYGHIPIYQNKHSSTIQNDLCLLCFIPGSFAEMKAFQAVSMCIALLALMFVVIKIHKHRHQ